MVGKLGEKITTGVFWSFVERFGNRIINFLVFIILARLLDPKDFGLIASTKIVIDYLDLLIGQGLGLAIIQRKDLRPGHLNAAFWLNMSFSLLVCVVIVICAPFVASFFHEPELESLLRWLSLALIISGLTRTQMALLTRNLQFKKLSILSLLASIGGGVVGLYLASEGFGVWALVWQQIIAALLGGILLWKVSSWYPGFSLSLDDVRDLYRFSVNIIIDQQVLFVSKRIDEGIIVAFFGVTILGYYSIAKRLLLVLSDLMLSTISKVLLSVMSQIQTDKNRLTAIVLRCTRFSAVIIVPIFVGGAVLAPQIIEVVYGPQWRDAEMAFRILMLSGPFLLFPGIIHITFLSIGKSELPLFLNTARSLLSVGLLYLGAFYGLTGVAIAVLAKECIGAILDTLFLQKHLLIGSPRYLGQFLPALPSVLIMWIFLEGQMRLLTAAETSPVLSLLFNILGGGFVYLLSLRIVEKSIFDDILQQLTPERYGKEAVK